jgi:hypothetical protein
VRGDSGYGNEGILLTLEARGQPDLLRLRQTQNVQRLVAQQFSRQDCSRPDNPGGRLEAITSSPLLLAEGKAASHANQTLLYLRPLHRRADLLIQARWTTNRKDARVSDGHARPSACAPAKKLAQVLREERAKESRTGRFRAPMPPCRGTRRTAPNPAWCRASQK